LPCGLSPPNGGSQEIIAQVQNFAGHRALLDTLLHEAAHAHDASFNHDTDEPDRTYLKH
jgi:hypothetical protein